MARQDTAHGKEWTVAGFLDTRADVLSGIDSPTPVIGDPTSFVPGRDDIFVVAIGDPRLKRRLIAPLRLKGAEFVSLRTRVLMSDRVRFGASVFGENARISVDCLIGDFAFIGDECVVGHDATVSDYAHVGTRSFLAGRVHVGEEAVIHPMSSVAIGVRIGRGATVGLGSVVFHDVPDGATVVGNPARTLPRTVE